MPWNIANLKELKFNNTYLYLGGFKNEKKFKYKENGYKCTFISNRCHITSNNSSLRFANATWFCFSNVIYNNDYK